MLDMGVTCVWSVSYQIRGLVWMVPASGIFVNASYLKRRGYPAENSLLPNPNALHLCPFQGHVPQ